MSLRFVGVDDADPRLPTAVIEASKGTTADDLAPGDTLADANTYTDGKVAAITPASIGAATAVDLDNVFSIAIGAVQKTGDTMLGHLVLPGDPTTEFQAVTKGYVDAHAGSGGGITEAEADARYVNLTGDTMTGDLSITGDLLLEFSSAYISGLDVGQLTTPNPVWIGEPTNSAHAATKNYVDTHAASGITQAAADTRYVNVTGDTLTGLLIGSGADFAARQTTTSDERGFRIQTSAAAGIAALTHDRSTMKLRNTLVGSPLEISVSSSAKISLITNAVERMKVEDAAVTSTVPVVLPANPTANLQAATKQYVDQLVARRAQAATAVAGVSIPNNANTVVALTVTDFDTPTWRSGNVFTPDVAGWYRVAVAYEWQSATATRRLVDVWKNGAALANPIFRDDIGSVIVPTGVLSGAFSTPLIQMNGSTDNLSISAFQTTNPAAAATLKLRVLIEYVPT